jgi:hypothetical protein
MPFIDYVRMAAIVLLTVGLLQMPGMASAADENEPTITTWSGTWTNRKYKSSGPLKCVATRKDDGTVAATFSGKFVNDPFSYNVTVNTKANKDRMTLSGTATLEGDKYQWSGYVQGRVLYGQFKSLSGHNGEFRLEETTERRSSR